MINNRDPIGQFRQHDPLQQPRGGGQVTGQDYTKFIQWTPLKVAIATLLLCLPYIAVVVVVAYQLSLDAALILLALPLCFGLLVGLMYVFQRTRL